MAGIPNGGTASPEVESSAEEASALFVKLRYAGRPLRTQRLKELSVAPKLPIPCA